MNANQFDWDDIKRCASQSIIGKRLPQALYVHQSATKYLAIALQNVIQGAVTIAQCNDLPTLYKIHLHQPRVSLLWYADFDTDPHPALHYSMIVDVQNQFVQHRDYRNSPNPSILHRKESFLSKDYPHYQMFASLTKQEVKLGLLEDSYLIGTSRNWQQRLQSLRVTIVDHQLYSTRLRTGLF
jgi:DNA phosphorothioation-associated putative methyltransferase